MNCVSTREVRAMTRSVQVVERLDRLLPTVRQGTDDCLVHVVRQDR